MNDAMRDKTALVLGANAGQADLIRYLAEQGWRVTACAHRPGGAGAKLAHDFALVDINDKDGVTELARSIGADLVYSVSSDMAVPAVVEASERLNLPHYFDHDLVALLDDKAALRAHLNERGLSVVPYRRVKAFADCADWSAFPCMVKPADSQGQRGVAKVNDAAEFEAAVRRALDLSPTGTAIVEALVKQLDAHMQVQSAAGMAVSIRHAG